MPCDARTKQCGANKAKMKTDKTKKTTSLRLCPKMKGEIDAAAERIGVEFSDVVRMCVKQALPKISGSTKEKTSQ